MLARIKSIKTSTKEMCFALLIGVVLLFAAAKIFDDSDSLQTSGVALTEKEAKISRLLEQIDGVGEASVMICETEDGVQSVVVVCEGANNLQVVLDVREAVAAALGTAQSEIRIYLKKA